VFCISVHDTALAFVILEYSAGADTIEIAVPTLGSCVIYTKYTK